MLPLKDDILKAAIFKTSRSGGRGGQNVNKVSSKVELIIDLGQLPSLNDEERTLIREKLGGRLDQDGCIHVISQEDRSQLMNKERTVVKLLVLLKTALHVRKKRRATKVPASVIKKRLDDKQIRGNKKELRRRPQTD